MAPPKGSRGGKHANSIVALLATQSENPPLMLALSKRQKDTTATVMDIETASSTPPTKPPPASASSTPLTLVHQNTQSNSSTSNSTCTALFKPAERKHILYFDLQIQPAQSTSKSCTASHQSAFMTAFKTLQEVDNTLSVFPYGQTNTPPEDLVMKDPDSLGTTIASLTKYCKGFFIRDTYSRMFLQVLLGFDQEPNFILSNAKAVLKSLKAGLYFWPLQMANTKTLGWLFGLHENTDLHFLTKFLEDQMKVHTTHTTPLLLGLKYKAIWDGTNKSDQKPPGV